MAMNRVSEKNHFSFSVQDAQVRKALRDVRKAFGDAVSQLSEHPKFKDSSILHNPRNLRD